MGYFTTASAVLGIVASSSTSINAFTLTSSSRSATFSRPTISVTHPLYLSTTTDTESPPEPPTYYPLYGPRDPPTNRTIPPSILSTPKHTGIDSLPCPAYTPHDTDLTGYLSAREDCWNLSCKDYPAVIAAPTCTQDVQAVVRAAQGERVAVLSGGHSPMCMPTGAFLISLRNMNTAELDRENMTVTAGGGAKIGEVDAVLQPFNLAAPYGTHPDTGIGGLTLGGGIGWLTPRVGLAIDNLVSAEVVLADGSVVTVDDTNHQDIYWAIRGGGGNFGVVTKFTYKVYEVGGAEGFEPGMLLGGIVPFDPVEFHIPTVIEKYATDCLATSSDDVQMLLLPNGGPAISVFTHHGTKTEAQTALDNLGKGYGTTMPPKDGVTPITWTEGVQTLTALGDPNGEGDLLAPGNPFYYTAGFVETVTPELSAFLAKAQKDAASAKGIHPGGAIVIMPLNGPFNDVPPGDTAISARNARFWVVFLLRLDGDEVEREEGIKWGRGLKKRFMTMDGVVTDMRLNEAGSMVDEGKQGMLPSQNEGCVERMRDVKTKYDPSNLFCYASLSK